jgi:hypothetical protein
MELGLLFLVFLKAQGRVARSPLSTVVLEPLVTMIRTDPEIRDVHRGGKEHKLLMYADDILLLVSDPLQSVP